MRLLSFKTSRRRHGHSKTAFYHAWENMRARCYRVKHPAYKWYGGRGIIVCDRWVEFKNFHKDMFSTWKAGLQLDRKDNSGNYEPSNCRWVTRSQNCKNRRSSNREHQSTVDNVHYDSGKWVVKIRFNSKEEAERFASETFKT